jgi:hypothetical protein
MCSTYCPLLFPNSMFNHHPVGCNLQLAGDTRHWQRTAKCQCRIKCVAPWVLVALDVCGSVVVGGVLTLFWFWRHTFHSRHFWDTQINPVILRHTDHSRHFETHRSVPSSWDTLISPVILRQTYQSGHFETHWSVPSSWHTQIIDVILRHTDQSRRLQTHRSFTSFWDTQISPVILRHTDQSHHFETHRSFTSFWDTLISLVILRQTDLSCHFETNWSVSSSRDTQIIHVILRHTKKIKGNFLKNLKKTVRTLKITCFPIFCSPPLKFSDVRLREKELFPESQVGKYELLVAQSMTKPNPICLNCLIALTLPLSKREREFFRLTILSVFSVIQGCW